MAKDLFAEANEMKSNYWKPEKVGDKVQGYLVKKDLRPNTLKGPGAVQTVYTLHQEDGTRIDIYGRQGNPAVISGLENCKMGQLVGVKFTEEKPAQKAGYNPTKIVKAYASDDHKPELVVEDVAAPPLGAVGDDNDIPFMDEEKK
jgi:hypothetical protein